jgi:hypothetical protein
MKLLETTSMDNSWYDEYPTGKKSAQNVIPRKRMTSWHAETVPLTVWIIENSRVGQNRWVFSIAAVRADPYNPWAKEGDAWTMTGVGDLVYEQTHH